MNTNYSSYLTDAKLLKKKKKKKFTQWEFLAGFLLNHIGFNMIIELIIIHL